MRPALAYGAMVLAAVALFLFIARYGEGLIAPPPRPGTVAGQVAGSQPDVLLHLLIVLTAVIIAGRILGHLFSII